MDPKQIEVPYFSYFNISFFFIYFIPNLKKKKKKFSQINLKKKKFQIIQIIYKQSEAEIEKAKKLYLRIKRKSISLVLPSLISKDFYKKVWTPNDFERETISRADSLSKKQTFIDKSNVKSCK